MISTAERPKDLDAAFRAMEEPAHEDGCIEGRPCSWSELTEYEKREAIFRGFATGPGVRYVPKRRYDQDACELALVRFFRATAGEA